MALSAPTPLDEAHDLEGFCCEHEPLNRYLLDRALHNHMAGAARCFVVLNENRVVGYYVLAAGSVSHALVARRMRRNMPDPIPVAVLGRLAVDREWMGQGIGGGLLKDALLRTINIADNFGVRAILCHAIDGKAKNFYLKHGFQESPAADLTMMVGIDAVRRALAL